MRGSNDVNELVLRPYEPIKTIQLAKRKPNWLNTRKGAPPIQTLSINGVPLEVSDHLLKALHAALDEFVNL